MVDNSKNLQNKQCIGMSTYYYTFQVFIQYLTLWSNNRRAHPLWFGYVLSVTSMPRCACPNVKDMGPIWLQIREMSERISLKVDVLLHLI